MAMPQFIDCENPLQRLLPPLVQTSPLLRLASVFLAGFVLASCATAPQLTATRTGGRRISHVRTTAFCTNEGGSGRHNATGQHLSSRKAHSAASDWSRYPLGTRFRVVGSNDEYVIDDYGWALIGTGTIDLHKASRAEVRRWGVRDVDIEVLEWGSREESLKVLRPRKASRNIRRMIAGLEEQKT